MICLICLVLPVHAKRLKATVRTDGAMVFTRPSFESDVKAYLRAGQKLIVSKKKARGFRKVKVKKGVIGYMRVEDLQVAGEPDADVGRDNTPAELQSREDRGFTNLIGEEDEDDGTNNPNDPIEYTRFGGVALGLINYSEDAAGQRVKENLTFFGMKFTGPDLLFDGPIPVDIQFLVNPSAPNYYKSITGNAATGFMILTDLRFLVPLMGGPQRGIFFATGPMLMYSQINTQLGDTALVAQELNLGVSFAVGAALRIKSMAIRAEIDYHNEMNKYFSAIFSFQFNF